MKKYVIEIIITEGNDEFWESLDGRSGCDDVLEGVKECFAGSGIGYDSEIRLVKYTDE